ncbi:hypothetical protein TRAPUB_12618 [Trametes pubescens]|uniref:Uncharacterized protein n=1 Tax=Trametes pubescens TaxID=154538 RepID=A0A1M2VTE0_TRAPU|nr:hypothetical protein TRAPUB_12618 [Trametes pubescens]
MSLLGESVRIEVSKEGIRFVSDDGAATMRVRALTSRLSRESRKSRLAINVAVAIAVAVAAIAALVPGPDKMTVMAVAGFPPKDILLTVHVRAVGSVANMRRSAGLSSARSCIHIVPYCGDVNARG